MEMIEGVPKQDEEVARIINRIYLINTNLDGWCSGNGITGHK